MNSKETLLDILKTLVRWRKQIIATTIGVGLLAAIIVLLMPNYYKAATIFYPANPDIAGRGALFGSADENMDLFGGPDEMNRLMLVAESSELINYLVERFDLYQRYDIDSTNQKAPHYVRLNFLSHYNLKKNEKDAMEITIEDKDPQVATDLLWSAIGKIDEINRRMVKANQLKILKSYQKSIAEKQGAYNTSTDSLKMLRAEYNIINVETQGEFLAEAIGSTESSLASNKAKLKAIENSSSIRRDSLLKVRATVRALEAKLQALTDPESGSSISIAKFNKGREVVALTENAQLNIANELQFLKDRYFQYETVYNTNISTLYVVEAPTVPVIKSSPGRTLIVLSSTMIAFLLSVLGVLLFENYKSIDWKEVLDVD